MTVISEHKPMLGILGGTFDPIHNGHIQPALACAQQLGIERIKLLPLGVAVHKPQPTASAEQRIAMCELVATSHPIFDVDTREIDRGGQSYSIITLQELRAELGDDQPLCWLMGQDAIAHFTSWKDWQGILKLAHIAVMRRGGHAHNEALPAELLPFVRDGVEGMAGCIVSVDVEPIEMSSTELRAHLSDTNTQNDAQALKALPESVRQYVINERIYVPKAHGAQPNNQNTMNLDQLKPLVIEALDDLKVTEITEVDVSDKTTMTDLMIVATGTSNRHVKSLANNVVMECKHAGLQPLGVEGEKDGDWVLVDLGDIIVHVMRQEVRDYYNIEKLWEIDPTQIASGELAGLDQ